MGSIDRVVRRTFRGVAKAVLRLFDMEPAVRGAEADLTESRKMLDDLREAVSDRDSKLTQLEQANRSLDARLAEVQSRRGGALAQAEAENRLLAAQAAEERKALRAMVLTRDEKIEGLQERIVQAQSKLESAAQAAAEERASWRAQAAQAAEERKALRAMVLTRDEKIAKLQDLSARELSKLADVLSRATEERQALRMMIAAHEGRSEELEARIATAQSELDEAVTRAKAERQALRARIGVRGGRTIFVTSIPKSGTHLLYAILEDVIGPPDRRLGWRKLDQRLTDQVGGAFVTAGHLRYSRGHALPKNVQVLALIRDPRAIALSMRDFLLNPNRNKVEHLALGRELRARDLEGQYRMLADGFGVEGFDVKPLAELCGGYITWPRVKVIRYEDLFTERAGPIIADALGVDQDLSVTVRKCIGAPTPTLNVGKPDRWRTSIPPKALKYIELRAGRRILELGYELSCVTEQDLEPAGTGSDAPPRRRSQSSGQSTPATTESEAL